MLGHESLGHVREAPADSGFEPGDLVVGVVQAPRSRPCGACARGEFDMCRNGEYTERGIKQIDGFGSERWTIEADYAMKLDPGLDLVGVLTEPTTIVAKAWDHIDRIGARLFRARRALVTGAGTIGLLAALLGVQRGLDVHVLDRVEEGIGPSSSRRSSHLPHERCRDDRGARPPDIVVEATGVPKLVFDVMQHNASAAVVCLTGVSPLGRDISIDAGQLGRDIVLENDVIFGSVNANLGHYELAAGAH